MLHLGRSGFFSCRLFIKMMRVEDSREAGLLNAATEYSSLETTRHVSEFDVPVGKRSRGKKRGYAVSVCVVLVAIAAIVSVTVVIGKKTEKEGAKNEGIGNETQGGPRGLAPAPGPPEYPGIGAITGWESSSPAPAVGAPTEPVAPPLFSPLSSIIPIGPAPLAVIDLSSSSPSLDLASYETICNKTVNRVDCLNMFRSKPNSQGDLKHWTVMAMEAAQQALNESYSLAQGMMKENEGNIALQQCIDVFADALGNVNTSMFLVSTMDVQNTGKTGEDVQTFMSAAMTNHDTCEEGIEDVGSFPGSDKITGHQAKHVDTMLSIALTFVNHLTTPTMDRYHHRRLLHVKSTGSGRRDSFPGILSKIGRVVPR